MLYRAKNGQIPVKNTRVDYIAFGRGTRSLIMLPGLGDGLMTVKGKALPFALMYRMYAKDYRVYVLSRGRDLPKGATTRDMAEEVALAAKQLGIEKVDIVGISQGGMIAQYLAIDAPHLVNKLVLAVTSARPGEEIRSAIETWKDMARRDAFTDLMRDNLRRMYTEAYLKRNPWMLFAAGKFGRPKSYDRFLTMADACISHDTYRELSKIVSPTLIISGGRDHVIGPAAAADLAGQIPHVKLHLYPALGHALYEEAPDFHDLVLRFLNEQS